MTQHSPGYSAVSASLITLYQIVLITLHFATPTTSFYRSILSLAGGQTLYQAAPLETIYFTVESSRELMSSEEYSSALRKLNNKQRQVMMFLLLLFKLSSQFSFVSFSFLSITILSLLPFSILSLLPFLISPSLSTIHSFSSD